MKNQSLKIQINQLSSGPDISKNLFLAENFLTESKSCELAVFPECALLWAKKDITHKEAKTEGEWLELIAPLSIKYKRAIIWGGIAERNGDKVYNTSFIIGKNGELIAKYRKTHLFQIFANDQFSIDETATYEHGDTGPVTIELAGWKVGISICYDLRFPEFYRNYAGCDLIINTAAFTRKTGKAHWEVLMRARAIENQCFMLGVGQCGRNELTRFSAYGHSLLIDPWGVVNNDLGSKPLSKVVSIDKEIIHKTRSLVPALNSAFPNL